MARTKRSILLLGAVALGAFYLGARFEAQWPGALASHVGAAANHGDDYPGTVEVGQSTLGEVVQVVDGDSLWFSDGSGKRHEFRLQGIDAPEGRQAFGDASRDALRALVLGRKVRMEVFGVDDYGRFVGRAWVAPPGCDSCPLELDVNLAQVEAGMAWWYRYFSKQQSPTDRRAYEQAERGARDARRGLWSQSEPVPPWQWRRQKKPAPGRG